MTWKRHSSLLMSTTGVAAHGGYPVRCILQGNGMNLTVVDQGKGWDAWERSRRCTLSSAGKHLMLIDTHHAVERRGHFCVLAASCSHAPAAVLYRSAHPNTATVAPRGVIPHTVCSRSCPALSPFSLHSHVTMTMSAQLLYANVVDWRALPTESAP